MGREQWLLIAILGSERFMANAFCTLANGPLKYAFRIKGIDAVLATTCWRSFFCFACFDFRSCSLVVVVFGHFVCSSLHIVLGYLSMYLNTSNARISLLLFDPLIFSAARERMIRIVAGWQKRDAIKSWWSEWYLELKVFTRCGDYRLQSTHLNPEGFKRLINLLLQLWLERDKGLRLVMMWSTFNGIGISVISFFIVSLKRKQLNLKRIWFRCINHAAHRNCPLSLTCH